MLINSYELDIVGFDSDGNEYSVPLYDTYNHHYIVYMGGNQSMTTLYSLLKGKDALGHTTCWHSDPPADEENPCHLDSMKNGARCLEQLKLTRPEMRYATFGGASGGEFRNNPHDYPEPFGMVIEKPEAMVAVLHFINTRNTTSHGSKDRGNEYSPYLECPCTSRRHFNLTNNTIDGCTPAPAFQCNDHFKFARNPSCQLSTYQGGYRCCENGVVLEETPSTDPPATIYAKFSFKYTHATPKSRSLMFLGCCDVTANDEQAFANIEYTVPQCAPGTPIEKCVHVATNVQMLAPNISRERPDAEIDLVYAAGHVHTGAIRLELIDEETNQLLCEADLKYGSSEKAGDEKGYLVGSFPCVWPNATPPRMRADHRLRTVAYYNSSVQRNGVMSLWLMSGAIVEPDFLV